MDVYTFTWTEIEVSIAVDDFLSETVLFPEE